jgi:toxin FitB
VIKGIVLDACVVSEPNRLRPDPRVQSWLARQNAQRLFLTATVLAELAVGVDRLPQGRRKLQSEAWLSNLYDRAFAGRVLAFDAGAALIYGRLVAGSFAQGRPPGVADAQIAATAASAGMMVATRNIQGFAPFGVPLVNPWEAS